MKFKRLIALILAAMMLISIVGCGSSSSSSNSGSDSSSGTASTDSSGSSDGENTTKDSGEPVYGGSLTVYLAELDSDYAPESPDFRKYMYWYEGLFSIDWSITDSSYEVETASEMTGQLAKDWVWDEDAQTLTVTLRDDVVFQTLADEYDYYGGRGLVAADVEYTYERLLGIGQFSTPVESMADWASTFYMVEDIETDGDYTVIFHFNTSSELAVNAFITGSYTVNVIGPEYDSLSAEQKTDWHYACGTGPYIVSDCVDGSYLTMVRNDNYYGYDERHPENQLPYLDSLTLVLITDSATLLANLVAGEVDIVGSNNGNVFTDSEMAQISDTMDPSAYVIYYRPLQVNSLMLKQTIDELEDINVRKALQYAINLQEIAEDYYGLTDWTITGLFSSLSEYNIMGTDEWADLYESYTTYDPDLARQMLADAGYEDGFSFTITYNDATESEFWLLVQEYLKDVNVSVELDPETDRNVYSALASDSTNRYCGTYELAMSSLNFATNSLDSSNSDYFLGKEDTIDEMITSILAATTEEEQKSLAQALDLYYMQQHYSLIVGPQKSAATYVSSKVGGYNGEALYGRFNSRIVLSHIWDTTAG